MVFWNLLRQSQLHKLLSNHLQKCNLHISSNQSFFHSRISLLSTQRFKNLPNNLRFFAAPAQYIKKEKVDTSRPVLNEMITHPIIRLVSDEGHKIVSSREALQIAKRLELDLVEVNRNAKPPVCKLMDYNKERYSQQVKEKERSKTSKANLKKGTLKEIRLAGQITPNDMKLKADTTRRLLEEGYRIKCLVKRKKPEDDLGNCLSRLLSLIQDVTIVEFGPVVEEDQAHFVLRHVKLGPLKGSGKKAKVASPSSASGIESENGSESDEDDRVFDAEDGASANVRPNKEELTTLPANRYAQPTGRRPIKEESTPPPANRYAKPTSRGPSIDSAGRPAAPIGTDNRYKREPRNYNAPVSNNGPRMQPPPTEQGRQPQFNPTSPQNREGQRPGSGNPNFPRQNSPGSSYGNFGAPNASSTHEQQNPPGQTNRYKKVSSGDGRLDNRKR